VSGFLGSPSALLTGNLIQQTHRNAFGVTQSNIQYKDKHTDTRLYVSGSSSSSAENWEREWNDDPFSNRQERMRNEQANSDRFLQGDDLVDLRSSVTALKKELQRVVKDRDAHEAQKITAQIESMQVRDAEYVYADATKKLQKARLDGDEDIVKALKQEIADARSFIPHFNLEGLWVGKYGSHGYEMINVTYVEDTLVAYKVTGDKNVPKGEITFKADLSPNSGVNLEPIELKSSASKQWGIKHLNRFPGKGQVASEGFRNAQWMEGQLIMVGEYFSFAWVPIGHQIFFGRPSADLTLKMLRESKSVSSDNDVENMKDLATRCMEETTLMIEEEECYLYDGVGDYAEGCFE